MQLLQHRARLALALHETKLIPLVLDSLEGLDISAVELASFLGKVLSAELGDVGDAEEQELVEAAKNVELRACFVPKS